MTESAYLINSPYLRQQHQLYLPSVDVQSQILAIALVDLTPSTPSYAVAEYATAFHWSRVFLRVQELCKNIDYKWRRQEFYIVEFRSRLKEHIDHALLFKLDEESHREATESGGLLRYWFGVPDVERRNLATCVWRAQDDAIAGGQGPWHKQARAVIPIMYDSIDVHGRKLIVTNDATHWLFEDVAGH